MDQRKIRFPVMLTQPEHDKIQAFRFANLIGTKAEAVRKLIAAGLEKEMAATGSKFGDPSPVAACRNNDLEIINAKA